MRKAALVIGPFLALSASFALFACEDSGGGAGSSGSFDVDSGAFEASAPGDGSQPVDASDAAPIDGVSVTFLRGNGGVAGATVVFHDAAGAVLETKTTDASGKAQSSAGLAVAQASLLYGSGSYRRILTWTAVVIGDQLVARDADDRGPSLGSLSVAPQGTFSDGGASQLRADVGSCSAFDNTAPLSLALQGNCVGATKQAVRGAALANSEVIAFAFAKDQAIPPTDGGSATIALGPWLAPANVTVASPAAPANASVGYGLTEIANGLSFEGRRGTTNETSTSPASFSVAPGFADAYQFWMSANENGDFQATRYFVTRGAAAASTTLAYAPKLPLFDGLSQTGTKARPDTTWTTAGNASTATADGGVLVLQSSTSSETTITWAIIVPPGSKGVLAPQLPPSAADWITGEDDFVDEPRLVFAESPLVADYAAFRKVAGQILPLHQTYDIETHALLPANGTLETSSYRRQLR